MAKSRILQNNVPDFQIPECIRQLQAIHNNVFLLKVGVAELIEAVEKDELDLAKHIIKRFELKHIIENLTTKE